MQPNSCVLLPLPCLCNSQHYSCISIPLSALSHWQ